MKLQRLAVPFFLLLLVSSSALFAQGTTGALSGTVMQSGSVLPGVTVSITSPALQGARTTVTNENGAYTFQAIPPGLYRVQFSLAGLQDVSKSAQVNLVGTTRLDTELKMAAVGEAITVTASQATVLETPQVESNYKQATINRLPMARTPTAAAQLSPGVTGGVNGPTISGAMSYDNLYLVNGAVTNENLRGQSHALFIEDAIQETTVLTGAISAEYGRFTGGVISSLTKSGGNDFSGSVRDSLDNPKWTAKSVDTQATPINSRNNTYEATLGGRILRDRLWFFTAGRQANGNSQQNIDRVVSSQVTPGYTIANIRKRFEGKLTGQITQKNTIVLSYLNNNTASTNNCQFGCLDFRTIDPSVKNPNNFKTAHYSGVLTNNFLLEADYAKKYFAFVGFGADFPRGATTPADLAVGTAATDQVVTGAFFNAPVFCGSCGAETRNNKEYDIKGHYFLGTTSLGTHNMVFGYDNWAEQRLSNNFQSATDFRFDILNKPPIQNADGTVSISIIGSPTTGDRFVYFPIALSSLGSNLKTDSVFLNDKWDLNQHFTFNVGARYDRNNAQDSAGNKVSNDTSVSPRIGAIFDAAGNGRLRFDVSYGKYVGRLAETVAGQGSAAGSPSVLVFRYAGPDIPYQDSRLAIQKAFEWFLANGGITRAPSQNPSIPGFNRKLAGELKSPDMREITVGAGTQIGKGSFRADYINRNFENFYVANVSLGIGTVTNPANANLKSDLILVNNAKGSVPQRKYQGLQVQTQYQLPAGFGVGGNYTYSRLRGNAEGETSGGGPVTYTSLGYQYPEYQNFTQNSPVGYLAADQRHKARVWASSELATRIGQFNLGLIQAYDSGTPFSMTGSIPIRQNATSFPNGVVNPGYAAPPTTVGYFFSGRGAERWDNISSTNFALNYELPISVVRFFAKGEVRNLFNRKGQTGGDTTLFTAANSGKGLKAFNPFTQTPKQCPSSATAADCTAMGANFQLGPNFGKPLTPTTFSQQGSYQLPRTYLASLGLRF